MNLTILHIILPLAILWCATGLYQAVFYSKGATNRPAWLQRLAANIHRLQNPMNYLFKAAYSYIAFVLMYGLHGPEVILSGVEGWLEAVKITLFSITLAHATMRILNPLRQGFINRGNNLPWIDSKENHYFEFILPWQETGIWIRKPFGRGWWRLVNSAWWIAVSIFIVTYANKFWL